MDYEFTKESWEDMAENIHNAVLNCCDAEDIWDAMHFGLGHIVWEDGNYRRSDIQFCLDDYEVALGEEEYSEVSLRWAKLSLEMLKLLPEYKQEWWDEDGE